MPRQKNDIRTIEQENNQDFDKKKHTVLLYIMDVMVY